MGDIEKQLEKALIECERLKKENDQLKLLLKNHNISYKRNSVLSLNKKQDAKKVKINERLAIFQSLFKGRDDVFAVRWEYNDGRAGYSPARLKQEQNKKFLPLTDQVIFDHLAGKRTIGIYPLLKDDTCWFLAIDFDKNHWIEDARAFLQVCKEMNVPASMERSRSGNGCHIWIFFQQAVPANLARKMGNILLTRTLEKRYQVGIDSYDRMFPNQDKLPSGGFGNLIALPLQHHPRKNENSVFIDEYFNAYTNQWLYLAQVKRMSKESIINITKQIDQHTVPISGNSKNAFENENIPKQLKVKIKNGIYISKEGLSSAFIHKLVQLATINNPAFYKAEASRLSTYNIPRKIDCTDSDKNFLILPRGCMEELKQVMKEHQIELQIKNELQLGTKIDVEFYGQLTAQQNDCVETMLAFKDGILSAATGFGKTVVAASFITKRKVNTLIIVHTKQLMEQWKERLKEFLKLDGNMIGQIGGGKNKTSGLIDIATIQSLNYKGVVKKQIKEYGQIIVDECHHIPAYSFENVLKKAEAAFILGLTATPTRRDGLHSIMKMQCGPIRYKVKSKDQMRILPFKRLLIPRKTPYKSKFKSEEFTIQDLYSEISNDEKRNEIIFNDVLNELENGSSPIILTERIEHVNKLETMFKGFAKNIIVLTGGMKKKEREAKFNQLKNISDDEERLIIATGKYIGEGFDNAVLDTLFLTMPISWKGTLQQYVGRLHRIHDQKDIVKVYDYVDYREKKLKEMFEKRKKGYMALGYFSEKDGQKVKGKNEQMELF